MAALAEETANAATPTLKSVRGFETHGQFQQIVSKFDAKAGVAAPPLQTKLGRKMHALSTANNKRPNNVMSNPVYNETGDKECLDMDENDDDIDLRLDQQPVKRGDIVPERNSSSQMAWPNRRSLVDFDLGQGRRHREDEESSCCCNCDPEDRVPSGCSSCCSDSPVPSPVDGPKKSEDPLRRLNFDIVTVGKRSGARAKKHSHKHWTQSKSKALLLLWTLVGLVLWVVAYLMFKLFAVV